MRILLVAALLAGTAQMPALAQTPAAAQGIARTGAVAPILTTPEAKDVWTPPEPHVARDARKTALQALGAAHPLTQIVQLKLDALSGA